MAQWYGLGYTKKEIAEAYVKFRADSFGYTYKAVRNPEPGTNGGDRETEVFVTKGSGRNSGEVENNLYRHFQGFVDGWNAAKDCLGYVYRGENYA